MQPHPSFQHLNSRSQPGNSSQDAPQAMTQHLQYVKAMQVESSYPVVENWAGWLPMLELSTPS